MAAVRYLDLVGKPYKVGARGPDAYDCMGVALEVLRRLGHDVDESVIGDSGRWESIEAANRPGDIVLSSTERGLHVDVVLSFQRKSALSSVPGPGVVVRSLHGIPDRVGAYRLR